MKRHLTEKELIEYQFKLASDAEAREAAEHIEGCADCREHLEKLKRKYSALDLLQDKTRISEDLISRVTGQAKQPVRKSIAWFKKSVWISSAAAVIVIGLILIVNQTSKDSARYAETAPPPTPTQDKMGGRSSQFTTPTLEMETATTPDITPPTQVLDKGVPRKATVATEPRKEAADMFAATTSSRVANETISEPEQPPFAPASAIELVTLPRRENVQLTIYNSSDMALVRERRNLTMKKGWNWLQFMWANTLIDPTSLSLEPLEQADKIDIQQLVFPARLRELGRWLIHSEVSGQVPFEITYFTSGLSWRAFYMGTLSENEKTMQLQGYVRVSNNSGEDYENAQTRLIVGNVHILDQIAELAQRQYPYNRPISLPDMGRRAGRMMDGPMMGGGYGGGVMGDSIGLAGNFDTLSRKEIVKEGLSEYFLYTIEGTETIPNQWGKRLLSFDAKDIEIESLYKYDEQRWGNQAIRFVKFTNDEEHNLGQTPIPNGNVKIYGKADNKGHLSYAGGTDIKYIPVDEEVELNLGQARLVKVEPKLMNFETDNYNFDRRGNVAGWDEIRTWKVEINNTRELPIEIEVTRGFDTTYWTIKTDVLYEKHDATHARFKLNLEPKRKLAFEYTVTTYHGTREDTAAGQN
ncbi:MAG: DUF4139 domain-containing protein [Sedimentisphaerales bacterium]|nr:DUF4139 domain-containing protein [Sedimentisphaerales bacterium]